MHEKGRQTLLKVKGARIVRRRQSGSAFELVVPEFHLKRGEMVCVVGESGCGKSTLLDFLALVLRPEEIKQFKLTIGDFNLEIDRFWKNGEEKKLSDIRRKHLGYVLQTGGLLPFLSVRQNLLLPSRLNQKKDVKNRLLRLSRQIGIQSLLDEKPKSLSGGQRQRVAILRAVLHRPEIVLADEPTAAVDRKRAQRIIDQFKELSKRQETSIIMVTHDEKLVENVADRWFGFKMEYPRRGLIKSSLYEIHH